MRVIRRGSNGLGIRYSGPKARFDDAVGRCDHIALLFLRKRSDSVHRRDFHRRGDCRRTDVERAAEDEREAQDVVDLVRIVGPARGDDGVVANALDLFGQDLRRRIRQRQDQRPRGHPRHHLPLEHAARREAEEDVRVSDDVGELARLRVLRELGLVVVHQHCATAIDDTFDVRDPDVLARNAEAARAAQGMRAPRRRPRS